MDISGQTVFFVARPAFVSRQRAYRLAARAAAIPDLGKPRAGGIAVYGLSGAISRMRQGSLVKDWERLRLKGVRPVSEISFLRAVGLMPQAPPTRLIEAANFIGLSGLDADCVQSLAIAGALEPEGEQFPFRDLRLGREISGLLGRGYALAGIAEAAALARRYEGAAMKAAAAEIAVRLDQAEIEVSGQTVLPLAGSSASLSEVLDQADEAEQDGDAETARRLYEIAAMARPRDAVIRYNLGCILIGLSRLDEAETHLRIAAGIDSLLAEAWFNIAHIRRLKGDADGEKLFLERALDADPDYADALVCLAKWFIARDAFDKARPLLDRIERAGGVESQREFVRKAVLLCDLAGRS